MKKIYTIEFFFSVIAILIGNIFWVLFDHALLHQRLLNTSTFSVIFSLALPIFSYGLYLSVMVCLSFLIPQVFFWLFLSLLSNSMYIPIVGVTVPHIIGELFISLATTLFLLQFRNQVQFFRKKYTVIGSITSSLSFSTLIISAIIAFNFYGVFSTALSEQNFLVPNSFIEKNLLPIYLLYEDDLHVTNINESFSHYLIRRAAELHVSKEYILNKTITTLQLPQSVRYDEPMYVLMNYALRNSVLNIIFRFKRLVPIVISLGLGVIAQVIFSLSSYIAGICTKILINMLSREDILVVVPYTLILPQFKKKK